MTGKRKPLQTQLRRSISEQLRDSTARAWDRLWKNVRERRLAAASPEWASDHRGEREVRRRGDAWTEGRTAKGEMKELTSSGLLPLVPLEEL
ncbi:hypothetical protein FD755_015365 [Muntiacus reevesi]|uniref:Uncharacterized protein n=1 Tax=Muntiacus reevesi TaxID=9886 RepID=A0A5N3XG42_MUNRE|nr:hypothetical protein FD755_015365 [Muntiacus reevesi]